MEVLLLTDRAGYSFVQHAGDVVSLPDDEAMRMVASGQAEAVSPVCAAVVPERSAALKRAMPRKKYDA